MNFKDKPKEMFSWPEAKAPVLRTDTRCQPLSLVSNTNFQNNVTSKTTQACPVHPYKMEERMYKYNIKQLVRCRVSKLTDADWS